jgi:hypothetical protein
MLIFYTDRDVRGMAAKTGVPYLTLWSIEGFSAFKGE